MQARTHGASYDAFHSPCIGGAQSGAAIAFASTFAALGLLGFSARASSADGYVFKVAKSVDRMVQIVALHHLRPERLKSMSLPDALLLEQRVTAEPFVPTVRGFALPRVLCRD